MKNGFNTLVIAFLLTSFLASTSRAAAPNAHDDASLASWNWLTSHYYIRLTTGALINKLGTTQTVSVGNSENYASYISKRKRRAAFDYGLSLGFYQHLWRSLSVQYGVGIYQSLNSEVKGSVYQYGLPEHNNFKFTYEVNNYRTLFDTRWVYAFTHQWQTFADIDAGYAWVTAHGYSEKALDDQSVPNPPFNSHKTGGFAYQLGIGVSYACPALSHWHWEAGVGYVGLTDRARLGRVENFATTGRIKVGHANAARIWLGVSYLA